MQLIPPIEYKEMRYFETNLMKIIYIESWNLLSIEMKSKYNGWRSLVDEKVNLRKLLAFYYKSFNFIAFNSPENYYIETRQSKMNYENNKK